MSRVDFLREMGAGPTQVKPRPNGSHGTDAHGESFIIVSICLYLEILYYYVLVNIYM
jgi:hypothetical protein